MSITMRWFFLLILLVCAPSVYADETLTLEVIDTYADLHTGPGKGYPKFYVIEQGEVITVLAKRPGWYEVQVENGKTGWTTAKQISRTLQDTGEPADLPTVSYGDYLKKSWRVGFSAGQFSGGGLDSADLFLANIGYRFNEWFELEVEGGKFYRDDLSGELVGANAVFEPFSQYQFSPTLNIGAGQIKSGAQDTTFLNFKSDDASYYSYGLGVNYYLGRNFIIKLEYRGYEISDENNDERLDAWKIGFSSFF